jgi:hypothetical protein
MSTAQLEVGQSPASAVALNTDVVKSHCHRQAHPELFNFASYEDAQHLVSLLEVDDDRGIGNETRVLRTPGDRPAVDVPLSPRLLPPEFQRGAEATDR